jgi:hypothetical protein
MFEMQSQGTNQKGGAKRMRFFKLQNALNFFFFFALKPLT